MFANLFKKYPSKDLENMVVFTCCHVIEQNKPILYVKHDHAGDWQFLCGADHTTVDARIVALKEVIDMDSTMFKLANLKCGRTAVRENVDKKWKIT